jgi:hypothetical protein
VAVSGTYAYVADANSGLLVIDIANPASPQIVGSVDTPGHANGVAVSGTYAYIADYDRGLQVIDIANPQNPQIVGSVDTPDLARGVAVSGSYVYVADAYSGLVVIDVTNPQSPQIVGGADTPGYALDVAVSGTQAYVSDASGLAILPAQCDPAGLGEDHRAESTMVLRAYPNPASCQTLIRFETRNVGLVQASVYDPAGRQVRGLSDGILGPSVHDLSWDGRDDAGHVVEAGIYLVRISTAEETTTGRFVIVR